jgi:MSHA biogenesis protein MshQ
MNFPFRTTLTTAFAALALALANGALAASADLASGTYTCLNATPQTGNINELNMRAAQGEAIFLEVKVLNAALPRTAQFCYTEKSGGGTASTCKALGSSAINVYRDGSIVGAGDSTAATPFAVNDYLVLNLAKGTNNIDEVILVDASNQVLDYIRVCTSACSGSGYWTTSGGCGAALQGTGSSVKDISRFPVDGTGTWTSNTLNSDLDPDGTTGYTNNPATSGTFHHVELQHATGSGLSCDINTITIKACADANSPCTAYTGGISGTLSAGGTVFWDGNTGGAAGAGFVIPSNSRTVTKSFQATTTGTLGTASVNPAAPNATRCTFGNPSCTFTATDAGFIFSDTATGDSYTIPTHTAGTPSATNYYLRAVQASTTDPAVCTPAIANSTSAVKISYTCNNPGSCQSDPLLTLNSTLVGSAGGDVSFTFDGNGSAPVTFLYQDVGRITVNASKTVTPTGGARAVTLNGTTNPFVVKPARFGLSAITCGAVNNPSPAAATDPDSKFCNAGANFSVTATALTATGATAKNYGRESPPESIKLSAGLPADLGLTSNPGLSGTLGAINTNPANGPINTGAATGTAFSWNEVGIITLTPSVNKYLGASDGDVSGTAVNVGRFVPDHYDVTLKAPAPLFAYSGQPIAVEVTAKLATPTPAVPLTATSVNYMAAGFPKKVTLSALAADGSALAAGLGTLSSNDVLAADFSASIGPGTPVYTFTAIPTKPTVIRLHAKDTDNVTSALTEASIEIRSGRLRLSNAFGRANADLSIPTRAEYWSGNSWLLNSADSMSKIPAASVALNPSTDLKGVTVQGDVTLSGGKVNIVLTKPTSGTGSVDLAVNLGGTKTDQSCLGKHPDTTGAALPWLRSQNGQNVNCTTNIFDHDPSARGNFGIYPPETRRVIHIRELFN